MNDLDSERLSGSLKLRGYKRTGDEREADVILLNTCSIRDKSEQKVFSRLGELRIVKQKRGGVRIGVCGCVAQQEGEKILARAPWVDFVMGPGNVGNLDSVLDGDARLALEISGRSNLRLPLDRSFLADEGLRDGHGRVQQELHVLHRSDDSGTRGVTPFRGRRRRVGGGGWDGTGGDRAAGPDGERLPLPGERPRFRSTVELDREDRRSAPSSLHDLSSSRDQRFDDRCDARSREHLAVSPPAGAVGLVENPEADEASLHPGEIPRNHRPDPRSNSGDPLLDGSDRRLPRRDGRRLPADPQAHRRGALRFDVRIQVFAAAGDAFVATWTAGRRRNRVGSADAALRPARADEARNPAVVSRAGPAGAVRGTEPPRPGDAGRPHGRQLGGELRRRCRPLRSGVFLQCVSIMRSTTRCAGRPYERARADVDQRADAGSGVELADRRAQGCRREVLPPDLGRHLRSECNRAATREHHHAAPDDARPA